LGLIEWCTFEYLELKLKMCSEFGEEMKGKLAEDDEGQNWMA